MFNNYKKTNIKTPPKYWSKRLSQITQPNIQGDHYLQNLSLQTRQSKHQFQHRIIIQSQKLKTHNKSLTQQLFKIVYKLQALKSFNSNYNQKIVDGNNQIIELKCPHHNSVIILFCKNDMKLMCVNCAYGGQLHKKHIMIQASKAKVHIQSRMKQIEKTIRETTNKFQKNKSKWQQILSQAQHTKNSALNQIQQTYNTALGLISSKFAKYRDKIQDIYKSTTDNIKLTIKSFGSTIKALHYQNPLSTIKHLYIQNVIEQIQDIQHITPNISTGNNMNRVLGKITKIHVKNFKNFINKIKNDR